MADQVTAAEVEQFKVERLAEREFVARLQLLVRELAVKVPASNSVVMSMQRFLKARV